MSKYTELAMERRTQMGPDGRPQYNCAQAVVSVFAADAQYDEADAMKAAEFFRGGMQIGSVCGALTGGLMALGLAGVEEPTAPAELFRTIKDDHEGMINCRDLLRASAERGEVKKVHCDGMICECVSVVEEILRRNGKL